MTKSECILATVAHLFWTAIHVLTAICALTFGIHYGVIVAIVIGGFGVLIGGSEVFMIGAAIFQFGFTKDLAEFLAACDVGVVTSSVAVGTDADETGE